MEKLVTELLNGIFSFICKFIELLVQTFTRQRKMKRILSFKKKIRTLVLPLREGYINGVVKTKNYVSDEVEAIAGIIETLSISGYSTHVDFEEVLFEETGYDVMAFSNRHSSDYIVLGGPAGNRFTCEILRKYFPHVKLACGETSYKVYEELGLSDRFYKVSDGEKKRNILYEECGTVKEYEIGSGHDSTYIILIKMTSSDFQCKDNGTVHIVWGGWTRATKAAALLFIDFQKEMYRRLKKHRDHYFIVCEYCKDFGVNFERWKDLTDVMFASQE